MKDTDGTGIRFMVNKYLRGLMENPELLTSPHVLKVRIPSLVYVFRWESGQAASKSPASPFLRMVAP